MIVDLDDDVAIVTGAASGIGRAIAVRFAEAGADVVVADIDADGGADTVAQIEDTGGTGVFVDVDVSDGDDVGAMVEATSERFGGIDILVNNAGGSLAGDDNLHRIDESTWRTNIDVNLTGSFLCSKAVLPEMAAGGGGRMVHMSSVNALMGIGLTSYSSAKSGLFALSRTIATQYGRHGIRSNVICPGTIETENRRREMEASGGSDVRDEWLEQYALDRFGTPDDVADAALYLASDMSSFVTGTELLVDGGLTTGLDHSLEQAIYGVDEVPE
ncbi:SDR family NAD(P)-dependent oxidoreductase [Halarchaeum nitratireducens]|uniref:Oxidoreductase n=1 Tax=Halarchaeum nitratireducens TaxID=489913 RepID=A0A830GGF3_9EURY|nr:SDR family NAD(P)-dependent oxidoreductase [Halarchaeum nitratireducens]GGN24588.1 oxidoreductase [Halarchaeum nitratireducens]